MHRVVVIGSQHMRPNSPQSVVPDRTGNATRDAGSIASIFGGGATEGRATESEPVMRSCIYL